MQRTYGAAAQLLELGVLLRRLAAAFERGSLSSAQIALDDTRCELSDEERELHEALEAAVR